METFMPVAQGPNAKALIKKIGLLPTKECTAIWSAYFTAARSFGPLTQLLGVPLVQDDSSMTTPALGKTPPTHLDSIEYFLIYDSFSIGGIAAKFGSQPFVEIVNA